MTVVGITGLLVLAMQSEILGAGLAKAKSSALCMCGYICACVHVCDHQCCDLNSLWFSSIFSV